MPRKSTTRAACGAGTIRKRSDGRWEARYVVGHDPGTGKMIRRSVYASTQREVRKKLSQIIVDLENNDYIEPNHITVGQWLDTWVQEYTTDLKPLTVVSYKSVIEKKLKPNLGAVKLSELKPLMVTKLYNKLSKDLSPKTLKNIHGVFHAAMEEAVRTGYIKINPVDAVRTPKVPKAKLEVLQDDDIKNFVEVIHGTRYELLMLIALFTGLRRGELLGLTWDCIDFDHNKIDVRQQFQFERGKNARYFMSTPKNGKGRTITVAPTVMQLFRRVRVQQAEWRLANGPIWISSGDVYTDNTFTKQLTTTLVFTQEDGKHIMPDTVYHAFKRAAEAIGKPELRFHDLRHSYAVASIQAGDDVKIVQHNMGHATAAFTLDVYAEAWDSMKTASASRMESFINSIGVVNGVVK